MDIKSLKETLNLTGKTAIITGGAKGIGKAIASRLAEAGAKVLIADMDEAEAKKTVAEFKSKGFTAAAVRTDVSVEADVKAMVTTCQTTFGSVDILVNNAGIYPSASLVSMTEAEFEKVMHVNLRSVFLATKYASELMKQRGGGRIINITSIDAIRPSMVGLAHYDASKHGVWGFTQNVALELAPFKIWVNAIAPGGIMTPGTRVTPASGVSSKKLKEQTAAFLAKIPMGRMGDPDEIGKVALFLASDMASYITGSHIVADGGALLA